MKTTSLLPELEVGMAIPRGTLVALTACFLLILAGCSGGNNADKAVDEEPRPTEHGKDDDIRHRGKPLRDWIAQLQDRNKETRLKAAQELIYVDFRDRERRREDVLAVLRRAPNDKDSPVRSVAADSLSSYGQHAVPLFLDALNDKDVHTRSQAARTRGAIAHGRDGYNEYTKDSWRSRVPSAEEEDAGAFPVRPEPVVTALAEALLKDKNSKVRNDAAMALWQIGTPSVQALDKLVWSEDAEARKLAVGALGRIGKPAVPALITALKSQDSEVRLLAVKSFRQVGTEARQAVPALAELLKEKNEDLRREVANCLGEMSDAAGAALPALLRAAKAEDQGGKAALDAVQKIYKAPDHWPRPF